MGHTDNGSVIVLFNVIGGLQILDERFGWRYVAARTGTLSLIPKAVYSLIHTLLRDIRRLRQLYGSDRELGRECTDIRV